MESKAAIVTGAGRGIGRAVSLRLADLGYNTVLAARSVDELESVAEECRAKGVETLVCPTDIRSEADISGLFEKTAQKFKFPSVLVNNAGIGVFKPLEETTLAEWNDVMQTNLTGPFLCCREVLKAMKANGGGMVINIASVVGIKGYPNQSAYTAAKHGLVGLSKVLAEEGREHDIRVHVICPGGVATDMVKKARPDIDPDELIQPDDVADLVEYFVKLPKQVTVDLVHLRRYTSASF